MALINGIYIHVVDESGEANKVTYDNFNRTVFLTINNGGEDDG